MNVNDLQDALKTVGWGLVHYGCGHFRFINPNGKISCFTGIAYGLDKGDMTINKFQLDSLSRNRPFGAMGKNYIDGGIMTAGAEGMEIESVKYSKDGECQFVSIIPKGKDVAGWRLIFMKK